MPDREAGRPDGAARAGRVTRRLVLGAALCVGCATALPGQTPSPLGVERSADFVCADSTVVVTAKRGDRAADVRWRLEPSLAGSFVDADGRTVRQPRGSAATFRHAPAQGDVAVEGRVRIIAEDGDDRASTEITLLGICAPPYGGEITRVTLGFEQIGASGIESDQKYMFETFISRPLPRWFGGDPPRDYYYGTRVRWWGNVRIASYPQQVTTPAAAFATGFVASAGKVPVNRLVQTAEFTSGFEVRVASSSHPVRGLPEASRQRFALYLFAGGGAVGPFPLDTTSPLVYEVPAASTPQGIAFRAQYPAVTTQFVAFRPTAPDRFLGNVSGGLRLYTFYTDPAGQPLATAPAMVSVALGRNDLIVPRTPAAQAGDSKLERAWKRSAWHVSTYYPFPLGDRGDPSTIIIYLFGDVWMSGGRGEFDAPAYQLRAATEDNQAVEASDARVTVVPVVDQPRDTYRLGIGVDLLKVWRRLVGSGATPATDPPAEGATSP